jgi:uncharacterized protein YegP (UPF0339 family)
MSAPKQSAMQFEIHQENITRLTSLRNAGGDWRWELVNDAGEILVAGAGYKSIRACRKAVNALIATNPETPIIER